MKPRMTWVVVLAAAVALACSGGGSGTSSSDLVGTWNVTKYEFVSTSSSATKVELISIGASSTIVLKSDGTYRLTITMPGEPEDDVTGTWSASSDTMTTTEAGMSGNKQFDYVLSGSTLTLTGADSDFDFDNDGVSEPAKLNITVVKG